MSLTLPESIVMQKTQELCRALLDAPELQSLRQDLDAFLEDEEAKGLYRAVVEEGELLHQRQHAGETLRNDEISAFELKREQLLHNTKARSFIDAQQAIQKLQETVSQYVGKTIELGRVPTTEDFPAGSCGEGCGCHH